MIGAGWITTKAPMYVGAPFLPAAPVEMERLVFFNSFADAKRIESLYLAHLPLYTSMPPLSLLFLFLFHPSPLCSCLSCVFSLSLSSAAAAWSI